MFSQAEDQSIAAAPPLGRETLARVPKSAIRNPDVLCEAYDYPQPVAFSRGMRVELDGCAMLFLSGTASVDERGCSVHPGDFAAQTQRVFSNLSALLTGEGADWHDVVRTTCYLVDFRHYEGFNAIRNRFYAEHGLDPVPASTCVQAGLCRPELLVEIELIAMVPKDRLPADHRLQEARSHGRSEEPRRPSGGASPSA